MGFYIRNIQRVRGKRRLDLAEDPAPDLIIEIDITSSSRNRLQVCADLGVAEVWVYDGESVVIQQLQNGLYIAAPMSQFFPNILISEMTLFLQQAEREAYLTLVKAFRNWVRSQIQNAQAQ